MGRCVLVRGECGTGKTILGAQFMCNGITQFKEPGVLVMLEQNPVHYKKDMLSFGLDIAALQESSQLVVIDASLSRINLEKTSSTDAYLHNAVKSSFCVADLVDYISAAVKEIGARRVVIDNLPALDNLLKKVETTRDEIVYLSGRLRGMGVTSLVLSDILNMRSADSEYYVSDGVILLENRFSSMDNGRRLTILKMRGTAHSEHMHPLDICGGLGIKVQDRLD